jgi:hypothetical protein
MFDNQTKLLKSVKWLYKNFKIITKNIKISKLISGAIN